MADDLVVQCSQGRVMFSLVHGWQRYYGVDVGRLQDVGLFEPLLQNFNCLFIVVHGDV
jgi:hypothetical protein